MVEVLFLYGVLIYYKIWWALIVCAMINIVAIPLAIRGRIGGL